LKIDFSRVPAQDQAIFWELVKLGRGIAENSFLTRKFIVEKNYIAEDND
jgi:hypothetical protein